MSKCLSGPTLGTTFNLLLSLIYESLFISDIFF
jgi:hypothetical protein